MGKISSTGRKRSRSQVAGVLFVFVIPVCRLPGCPIGVASEAPFAAGEEAGPRPPDAALALLVKLAWFCPGLTTSSFGGMRSAECSVPATIIGARNFDERDSGKRDRLPLLPAGY